MAEASLLEAMAAPGGPVPFPQGALRRDGSAQLRT